LDLKENAKTAFPIKVKQKEAPKGTAETPKVEAQKATENAEASKDEKKTEAPSQKSAEAPKDEKKTEAPTAPGSVEAPKAAPTTTEEEEEEEDDECELTEEEFKKQEAIFQKNKAARQSRFAVSADCEERDESWQAPVHKKDEDQEERLKKALETNVLFSFLSGKDLASVILAFEEHKVEAGTKVLVEGDEVESGKPALFVFERGKLSVYKKDQDTGEVPGKKVHTYDSPGQYFGDLALLYNAPRAATVIADEECTLWSIDRNTFNYLVKDAARQAQERRREFLKKVPLLEKLNPEQMASLCDVMEVRMVAADTYLFQQGDTEPLFFCILEDGLCCAEKDGDVVYDYDSKDFPFFGELALLRNDPRATSIRAKTTCKVLCIGSEVFHRMVGHLEEGSTGREFSKEALDKKYGSP
jgi:cAMP-dependent protein kinase regulator